MTLPSIDQIQSGRSILFLGAGFSAEATNVAGQPIKSVRGLLDQLLDACQITDKTDYDLDSAASEHSKMHGDQATINLLHNNFRSNSVTEPQRIVVCQPWYRIYTTNYDDVVERICIEEKKPYTTKETNDFVEPPTPNTTQLLHIYGNITRASGTEFRDRFLLTETQRDNSPFLKSAWFRRFSEDVLSSSSVVFVGFSLNDIDIRRLLGQLPDYIRQKIHFIGRAPAHRPTKTRLERFGTFYPIEVTGLADHLGSKRPGAPVTTSVSIPPFLEEITFVPAMQKSVSSLDIQFLLSMGILDRNLLAQADVSGEPGAYSIFRGNTHYNRASNTIRPVVVHSDIGNGKTVFAIQCGYIHAGSNYRVFLAEKESERDEDVVAFLQELPGKILVIFDDILRFRSLIKRILGIGRADIKVLMTTRSSIMETSRNIIEQRLGNISYVEIDLNTSQKDERSALSRYLRENGLLGDYADFSPAELDRFLEANCGWQLRDVILALFETGILHDRVSGLMKNIKTLSDDAQRLTIFGALLTFTGLEQYSDTTLVTDLVGFDGSYETLREQYIAKELHGLIRLDKGLISFRSAALAKFLLARISNLESILAIVKQALFQLNSNYSDDQYYDPLSRGLLRYSHFGALFPSTKDATLIEKFYDDCRVLSIAQKEPLFWVQRSICNMNANHFNLSDTYVETAYALARKLHNYDTYQIDNHYAKLTLTKALKLGVSPSADRERQAQELLDFVIRRKHDDLYHPLSVMRLYVDIVNKWADALDDVQKAALKVAITDALSSMTRFSFKARARFRNIDQLIKRLNEASARL